MKKTKIKGWIMMKPGGKLWGLPGDDIVVHGKPMDFDEAWAKIGYRCQEVEITFTPPKKHGKK